MVWTYEKTDRRNENGVKYSSDMYRTFNGVDFRQWSIDGRPEVAAMYRAAGVRCRRVVGELFIRRGDEEAATDVYAAIES